MTPAPAPANPKAIAKLGEDIYKQRYQAQYEASHAGMFAAINIRTEEATLADAPDEALLAARAADPQGMFHLIRVGFAGAFRIRYAAIQSSTNGIPGQLRSSSR